MKKGENLPINFVLVRWMLIPCFGIINLEKELAGQMRTNYIRDKLHFFGNNQFSIENYIIYQSRIEYLLIL